MGGTETLQSVDRAVFVLDWLARQGEAGVTEVARALGVHKSTAFRLLATLVKHEMAEQVGEHGRYRVGVGLFRLAGATTTQLDLVQQSRPSTLRLAEATGETVTVAVQSGRSALYVDQIAGSSTLQPRHWIGQHAPLHATSDGKVLLSGLDPEALRRLTQGLPAFTPFTLTHRGPLAEEVARVRTQGYAVAVDELEVGITAVASPIRNAHGEVIASLGVSGATLWLDRERRAAVVALLLEAADEVSVRLGGGCGADR